MVLWVCTGSEGLLLPLIRRGADDVMAARARSTRSCRPGGGDTLRTHRPFEGYASALAGNGMISALAVSSQIGMLDTSVVAGRLRLEARGWLCRVVLDGRGFLVSIGPGSLAAHALSHC